MPLYNPPPSESPVPESNISSTIPSWLLGDIQTLLTKQAPSTYDYETLERMGMDVLSQESFRSQYEVGDFQNPVGWGRPRYYYNYDFSDTKELEKEKNIFAKDWEGYKFHSPESAYENYLRAEFKKSDKSADLSSINLFSTESIMEGIAKAQGKTLEDIGDPSAYRAFTPEMIRRTTPGHYTGFVEQEREPLLTSLIEKNRLASGVGAGIEGYGRRQRLQNIGEQEYMTGVENIYGDVASQQMSGMEDIRDILAQFTELV